MKMAESIDIARAPGDVFAYVSDVSNDRNWQQTVVEAKVTSEGPIGVGSTGVHRVKFMGMTDDYGWKIEEFDAPNRASWRFTSGPMSGKGGYILAAAGSGTSFTWTGDVQAKGVRRMLEPLMGPMFRRQVRKELQALKRILESKA